MPNNDFHTIPIDQIVIGDRFRKELSGQGGQSIDYLIESIRSKGLLHPVIVERNTKILLAGGRRLSAVKNLGWADVAVHYFDELSEVARREIELEENLARKNLTWQEQALLTTEIDDLKRQLYGNATAGRPTSNSNSAEGNGWSLRKTAELRSVALGTVQQDLRLANALKIVPSLAKETSRANALRAVDRLEEDLEREIERRGREKEAYVNFSNHVKCGDATSLILDVPNESIDCIITDPPYGLDLDQGRFASRDGRNPDRGGRKEALEFDDSPEATIAILRSIAPQLRRVLKPSGHLYAFFGEILWRESLDIWRNAGFDVRNIVNIWSKSGGATGAADWDHNFAPAWEPFIFASNRMRRLAFKRKNVFTYSVELGSARFHPTQKPVELLRELIQLSTEPNEIILDPFCGVGSTLVAASQLRRRFLGFELNDRYVQIALQRLVNEGKERPFVAKPEL